MRPARKRASTLAATALILLVAITAGAAAVRRADTLAGAAAPADHDHATMAGASASGAAPDFEREMTAGMARMMEDMHAPGYSGKADIDFLAMMIPHHAGAVDMARLVLQYGRDPATRMLAEEIIAGQTIEIESMTRRLAALRQGNTAESAREFPALGGTRGP